MITPLHRRGFSLTEVLIAVAIIAVLASITLVSLGKARKAADKARLGFQLQTIAVGIQAYETDFNSYPLTVLDNANSVTPTSGMTVNDEVNRAGLRGARLLCKALMGATGGEKGVAANGTYPIDNAHQDGKSGLGFAVVGRSGIATVADTDGNLKGRSYGPYLAADKFKISNTVTTASGTEKPGDLTSKVLPTGSTEKYDDTAVLLDGNDQPILYYPTLNPQPSLAIKDSYTGPGPTKVSATPTPPLPMYRTSDNNSWLSDAEFRHALGDTRSAADTKVDGTPDGIINPPSAVLPAETAVTRVKFILWSCGPDGFYGRNPKKPANDSAAFDDVTNFQGE